MHIRITTSECGSTGPSDPRFSLLDLTERMAGDGQREAFARLVPKRDGLTPGELLAEIERLRGLGHEVTGERSPSVRRALEGAPRAAH